MSGSFLQVEQFPDHDRVRPFLMDYMEKLRARFIDCSRGVMTDGWRSPIGQWASGPAACPSLSEVKVFVQELLPWPTWDFFTWFEHLKKGGLVRFHNHWEHQYFAYYHIEGNGEIRFQLGQKQEVLELRPGLVAIAPGMAENGVVVPAPEPRFSLVVNANMVVKQGKHPALISP